MQSDKLPKMPVSVFSRRDVVRDGVEVNPMFTYRQVQEYALAARAKALEEVRAECNKRVDEMSRMERHRYLDGARGEAIAIELWLKDLMEQDA